MRFQSLLSGTIIIDKKNMTPTSKCRLGTEEYKFTMFLLAKTIFGLCLHKVNSVTYSCFKPLIYRLCFGLAYKNTLSSLFIIDMIAMVCGIRRRI